MAEDIYYRFTRKEYDSVRLLESVTDCNGLGHLIIQLFLLDGFQPFITII